MKESIRKRAKAKLARKVKPRTAAQIQMILNTEGTGPFVGLGTLSSLLKKMVDDGELQPVPGVGPHGGTGYKLYRGNKGS